jgi:YARHG domain
MCQVCYEKGYADYPAYNPSVAHIEDYKRGYKAKQYATALPTESDHVFFCESCYQNGKNNSKVGIWAPPSSAKRGHFESYEKGYNQVEVREDEKVPGFLTSKTRVEATSKANAGQAVFLTVLVLLSVGVLGGGAYVVVTYKNNIVSLITGKKEAKQEDTAFVPAPSPQAAESVQPAPAPVIPAPVANNTDTFHYIRKDNTGFSFTDFGSDVLYSANPLLKSLVFDRQAVDSEISKIAAAIPLPPPAVADTVKKDTVHTDSVTNKKSADSIAHVAKPADTAKRSPFKYTDTSFKYVPSVGKYPMASLKMLNDSDLNGISVQDLKIMRNEIFARHGLIFQPGSLNTYFSAQQWYHPAFSEIGGKLTKIEKHNIDIIAKKEKSKPK